MLINSLSSHLKLKNVLQLFKDFSQKKALNVFSDAINRARVANRKIKRDTSFRKHPETFRNFLG